MEARVRERYGPTESGNVARGVALLVGLVLLALGLIGFTATGFTGPVALDTDDELLGFLDLNIFHNIVYIALGLILIVASRVRDVAVTQGVLIGVGLFVVVAALLGFLGYMDHLLSIEDELAPANFVHLLVGVVAVIAGLIGVRQQEHEEEPARARGRAAQQPRSLEERRALWDKEEVYREQTY